MTKIILRLTIEETGKKQRTQLLNLENNNPLVIGTDFFLSPHLSIGLLEKQPPTITFHSEEETMINLEDNTEYAYSYINNGICSIPKRGAEFYLLQKGDTFSITKYQFGNFLMIKAEVVLVDTTPHEELNFPDEVHVSP